MDVSDVIKNLNALIQLDIDACFAYGQAIDGVEEDQIRNELRKFKSDHERHVNVLSVYVREMGGTPPDFTRDFKGFLIEGMTAIRKLTGTKGSLNAMEMNEGITNRMYEKHAGYDYPENIREEVRNFLGDERKHIEYIRQMLHLLKAEHPLERKVCHVVPHEPEGWWVEMETAAEPVAKVATKEEAIDRARSFAEQDGKVVVHRRDGSVETEHTVGRENR